jgi:hypothetical protein
MQEIYVIPAATVAHWDPESMERAHELALQAVDEGEVEQIGRGYIQAVSKSGR